jgi:hypothetical protein
MSRRKLLFGIAMVLFGGGAVAFGMLIQLVAVHNWSAWPGMVFVLVAVIAAITGATILTEMIWPSR